MTGWQFLAREHSSSASLMTTAECITFESPTLSTYLNCMVASCHHNIGCRRWETTKHGWEILRIAVSCIGLEARRWFLFTPRPTHQSSIRLPPQACTGCLRPHLKQWKPRSFGGRQLSSCLGNGSRGSSSYLKSSWPKRTSIEARRNQSTRWTRMTILFARQTYLPPLLRETPPTSPSNEGPSPSIRVRHRPRRRAPLLLLPTTRLS
jgi:hypothetical protein